MRVAVTRGPPTAAGTHPFTDVNAHIQDALEEHVVGLRELERPEVGLELVASLGGKVPKQVRIHGTSEMGFRS